MLGRRCAVVDIVLHVPDLRLSRPPDVWPRPCRHSLLLVSHDFLLLYSHLFFSMEVFDGSLPLFQLVGREGVEVDYEY
jgi:hypothetical protein